MDSPDIIRLSIFIAVLLLCALWEWKMPRRRLSQNKTYRWANNLGLVSLNSLCLSIFMPILAFDAANIAQQNSWGLMHAIKLPTLAEFFLGILILDFVIYSQHLIFHKIPWLWRLHRMHHSDQDIDVTTGTRFHPIEIILSMWLKIAAIVLLGISPITVIVFEIILNASAMFNHSNARLSLDLDSLMRKIIVTPDMHRVHHSRNPQETHSNFGFFLSIWDRCFNTYTDQPELGHQGIKIGITQFQTASEQRIDNMLTQPFRNH
ncbi:hypothetical protein GCM10007938_37020 [Vibrio zhanjiangensis]|uniref:Fatty acid hydroxylase domain-containing protein n=1 Tax=Vibrio zhanjiangensis TaxID=1046128 RepID=A0ABQ6F3U5_9VIBR|nr:sterol desaturase family protein [Vibrio zhanjiangensis]GLT19919.1 hypothetical protein GCM10007938_37020 [Vibrio zhanjiangensis]